MRKKELRRCPELDFDDNEGRLKKDELDRANHFIILRVTMRMNYAKQAFLRRESTPTHKSY